jgi:general L-amino acid transport system permease protein
MDISQPMAQAGAWLRRNLFSSWLSGLATLIMVILLARVAYQLVSWAIVHAVWTAGTVPGQETKACTAAKGIGACWAIVVEKYRFILFATYPYEEQWRPAVSTVLLLGLLGVTATRFLHPKTLAALWGVAFLTIAVLMWGGVAALPTVTQDRWGGLIVTLLLATCGLLLAFPLAVLVALGRTSDLPAIRALCIGYVELIRGVPLISILFMAAVVMPLFLPDGWTINKFVRAQLAFVIFSGAYLAEVVRAGLLAVPKGQHEAAHALGLSYWQKVRLIQLPQALKITIPPLVNTFISFLKDTTLVIVVGLFDLLNAAKTAILDPAWQDFSLEVYIFCALIYLVLCSTISWRSQVLERELARGRN